MPGIHSGRKRPAIESDDESDNSYASVGSKRTRRDASTNGFRRPRGVESEDERDGDSHMPGSIVRVKLTNFVTYTAAEFNLGPSLNMIIGPNGTGKSTLVCAICLGLGWSPQNLGRAKDIGEFVKYGQPEAEIEIELAASESHRTNPTIRRIIRKEGNKSAFYIGNRAVPQKEVVALARSFSIQIDNLCQFLPQDRVVEFARLDPIALLRETQRAAAPEHMVQWHDQLKDLRGDEKRLEVEQENEQAHLKQLRAKQDATREDVVRWNERRELIEKSQLLEKCRPIIAAKLLKAEVNQFRAEISASKRELQQYESEIQPARRAQEQIEQYRDEIDRVAKSRKQRLEAKQNVVDSFVQKIEAQEQQLKTCADKIEAEKGTDNQRKQDAKRTEMEIKRLQDRLDDNPTAYDAGAFESRYAEFRASKSALEREIVEHSDNVKSIRAEVIAKKELLGNKAGERAKLDTQLGQQGNLLKKLSSDTAVAWEWLEKNKASLGLREDVYAPPILSCTIPDSDYADAIESQLRRPDFVAITCTNSSDSRIVQDKLVGTKQSGGLGLHNITIRTTPNTRPLPPVSQDELHQLGFSSWIVDHIVGPDPVLAMLCDSARLHAAAFASQPLSHEQFDALQKSKIRKWVSGREVFQISTRAEYGASSTSVVQLKRAQYFTGDAVDTEEKSRLEREIEDLKRQIERRRSLHDDAVAKIKQIKWKQSEIDSTKSQVQAEEERLRNTLSEWQALPRKIEDKKVALQAIRETMAETHSRITAIETKSKDVSLAVAGLTLQYAKQVIQLRTMHEDFVEAEIRLIEANSEVEGYASDNRIIQLTLQRKKDEIERLEKEKAVATAKCKEHMATANRIIQSISEAEQEAMQEYTELPSAEALDDEISTITSRLELMAEGNPGAIKAYEQREKDIKDAQETLDNNTLQLERTRESLTEIREKWEPELDALVAKISDGFSHNFHKIGCAGQVGVYKDEDFEKWAIQIQVRFRYVTTPSPNPLDLY